jgi:transcriptional regulator with XRE-family HTH domain
MTAGYSDKALVKMARGNRTQEEFANLSGISRPMLSDYERGAVTPSNETWLKMAELAGYPWNIYCWQRAGVTSEVVSNFLKAKREANESRADTRKAQKAKQMLDLASPPEPVTEPLGDEPVGGEPASLKGLSKTVEEFCARHAALPPVEPTIGERKLRTPAKKERGRRRKK